MAGKTKNKKAKKTTGAAVKNKSVKSSKTKKSVEKSSSSSKSQSFSLSEVKKQIKLDESYVSLVLGFLVVIVIFIAAIFFVKGESDTKKEVLSDKTPSPTAMQKNSPTPKGKVYVMKENESLWDIAVREYGDGYAYIKIVKANNFENPDYVPPGTKIVIPPAQ